MRGFLTIMKKHSRLLDKINLPSSQVNLDKKVSCIVKFPSNLGKLVTSNFESLDKKDWKNFETKSFESPELKRQAKLPVYTSFAV